MRTIGTDASNDLNLLPTGTLEVLQGIDAVSQTARQYASTLLGEMIHAVDQGVPFFGVAFGTQPNLSQFEAVMRRRLLECPGVLQVPELSARQAGDTLGYTATIVTEFGSGVING
jgi:hypothetical protein